MAKEKNFSEAKDLSLSKKCKFCKEAVPKIALAFSNTTALENNYCCWICMLGDLGDKEAYQILSDKARQNQISRMKL